VRRNILEELYLLLRLYGYEAYMFLGLPFLCMDGKRDIKYIL
jgi:hypothetical protein